MYNIFDMDDRLCCFNPKNKLYVLFYLNVLNMFV